MGANKNGQMSKKRSTKAETFVLFCMGQPGLEPGTKRL